MAQPQTPRRAGVTLSSSRVAIAQAALASFSEVGYHGTTMRHIASAAGATLGAIYHHFESKQAILQHVMTATLDDLLVETRAGLAVAGTDPRKGLEALVRVWIGFHTTRQREALVGSSEMRSLDAKGLKLVIPRRDAQELMFRNVVEAGGASGDFTTAYPVEATRAILNMGASVAAWYRPRGGLTAREITERYCRLALATVELDGLDTDLESGRRP
jgi:AcrR family transcriptional regulator